MNERWLSNCDPLCIAMYTHRERHYFPHSSPPENNLLHFHLLFSGDLCQYHAGYKKGNCFPVLEGGYYSIAIWCELTGARERDKEKEITRASPMIPVCQITIIKRLNVVENTVFF